jgi:hypothetical protein
MKQLKMLLITTTVTMLFTFSQCKKDKNKEPQLPPETTTGAMTFGCKVNGKVFVPKDGNGRPGLFVQYVNLGNVPNGGWHLNIPAYNYSTNRGINIQTDSLLLLEGMAYDFKRLKGFPLTFYEVLNNGATEIFGKLDNDMGNLFIKRHDQANRILAGTFYFTGTKISTGEKVNITDGRFDIRY